MNNVYPNNPGFQSHSDTSRAAAESMKSAAATLRDAVYQKIYSAGTNGRTCDECADALDGVNSTIGARIRELELNGQVFKTTNRRQTRAERYAVVYIAAPFKNHDGIELDMRHTTRAPVAPVVMGNPQPDNHYETACKEALAELQAQGYGAEHNRVAEILQTAINKDGSI